MQQQLACIVISFRGREDVVRAVASLLDQDEPAEVIVVNSGGNSPSRRLHDAGLDVDVLDVEQPLTPGGARNAGVAATSAPYVAFLAGDCWAAPGWIAGRLREHAAGAPAVAGRVVNPYPRNPSACAFHLAVHGRRMAPGARPLGLSYERGWLERTGAFRDTTEAGEDSEMRSRLGADTRIPVPPDVVTFHDHPTRLSALSRDMVARGRRIAAENRAHGRAPDRPPAPLYAADHVLAAVAAKLSGSADVPAREVLLGLPLALPAATRLAYGALSRDGRTAPGLTSARPHRRAASPTSAASTPHA